MEMQKLNEIIRNYANVVTSGILSVAIGIFLYYILIGIFHLSFIYVFVIVILISFLISPLLSKLKFGEKAIVKYNDFLDNLEKKMFENKNADKKAD